MGTRDPIDAAAVTPRLGPRWTRVSAVPELASTNAELLGDPDAPDGAVLVAEFQAAGRGRFDRAWVSPAGAGLTFSVLLRPQVPVAHWGWVPLLAGLAVADAVASCAPGLDVALKWPNDLLVAAPGGVPAKCAGILVQTGDAGAVVLGIGINVSTTGEELSALPAGSATSLLVCGVEVARHDLLVALLAALDARVGQWSSAGGDAESAGIAAAYRAACATIGRQVVVHASPAELRGTAVDVDPAGRLVLDVGGRLAAVAAGDVEHVRAANR